MCDLINILKNCGVQRGAVLKLFNKLRLQRSLRTKNTGTAQLVDIICVSATSLTLTLCQSNETDLAKGCHLGINSTWHVRNYCNTQRWARCFIKVPAVPVLGTQKSKVPPGVPRYFRRYFSKKFHKESTALILLIFDRNWSVS